MVWFEIAFHDPAVFLGGQGMKDLAQTGTNVPVQSVLSHLRDEDDMILAVPLGMSETVVYLRHMFSFRFGRHQENNPTWGGKKPQVYTVYLGLLLWRG
jgi:hypothetical protein